MKKLFVLLGVLAMSAGVVFAQTNVATVDQDGGNQTADVEQTGNTNNATVNQFTDNFGPQTSDVIQTGDNNVVDVDMDQTGGGGNGLNTAFIQQVGNDNTGYQRVNADGYNGGQHVTAYQEGNNNDVSQSILDGYTESLFVDQDGDRNAATQIAIGGGHNHGHIYQTGDDNIANQTINGSNHGYGSAEIKIEQTGNWNEATQSFAGGASSTKNNGTIAQTGNQNDAFQVADGTNIDLQITQTNGDLNIADQFSSGNGSFGFIMQDGNTNEAYMIQNGDSNTGTINQTGDGNWSSVTQNPTP